MYMYVSVAPSSIDFGSIKIEEVQNNITIMWKVSYSHVTR